jgi:hypothetical protein
MFMDMNKDREIDMHIDIDMGHGRRHWTRAGNTDTNMDIDMCIYKQVNINIFL